ncbi:unnamed protein product [Zymoseptoria tritici ST99CH_3D1]|nr:unnamed protein product [Zymoseptoria tritici ST99CH_3D1]
MASTSASNSDDLNERPQASQAPTGGKPMLARQRAKEEAEANGRQAPKGGWFPLGYKDGFSQWWASLTPAVTEHRVMSFIPYLQQPPTHMQTGSTPTSPSASMVQVDKSQEAVQRTSSVNDPYGPRQWKSQMVQLAGKNRYLNEFSVERTGEQTDNNLVMLHGYGAGLGFFYKNFEPLSRLPHWKLYALDMLGMGRSSRPTFKISAKDREAKTREAEGWFVDALEEWRVKKGIDKFTLLGHSLGGYMAVCYALKYPGHLNKLILASPVGIPEDPNAVSEALPEPGDSTLANEFTQDASKQKQPRKPLPGWLVTLWDANVSPFSLVRWSGPMGPRLVSGWTSRRFSHLPAEECQALHDYSYSLFRQRGSGEYALAYVLAPGAFARSPLIRRIHGVGRQFLEAHSEPSPDDATLTAAVANKARENGIPVVLMYGENDWMDVGGGHDSKKRIEAAKKKALDQASDREKQLENGDVKVTVIRKAGHHLYLEGYEQFNEEILGELKDVERRQKRLGEL